MKLKHMNVEIEYGNIIHNDGTVSKTTITHYSTLADFRDALKERNKFSNNIFEANIKNKTISIKEFVSCDEVFDLHDLSTEEEE
jgi:hypothetical protein